MIDNQSSSPFSARTLDPIQKPSRSFMSAVVAYSRATYAKPRFLAEEEIAAFYVPVPKEEKRKDPYVPQSQFPAKSTYQQRDSSYVPPRQEYQTHKLQFPKKEFQSPSPLPRVVEENIREERSLPIRKITDQTPLPQKRFDTPRDAYSQKEPTRAEVYSDNRTIEEQFHRPPQQNQSYIDRKATSRYEERKVRQDSPLKQISVPTFDDKPALSLKDALAKAMSEHTQENEKTSLSHQIALHGKNYRSEDIKTQEVKELKVLKEVDENILRNLIEE
jgi:hypothetical protein